MNTSNNVIVYTYQVTKKSQKMTKNSQKAPKNLQFKNLQKDQ